jgi:hypothetical protein
VANKPTAMTPLTAIFRLERRMIIYHAPENAWIGAASSGSSIFNFSNSLDDPK